jgi:hypothetical protein
LLLNESTYKSKKKLKFKIINQFISIFITANKMGVETSRDQDLPENINDEDTRVRIINSWTEDKILKFHGSSSQSNQTSTMNPSVIKKTAKLIKKHFEEHPIDCGFRVLEIFSGNGCASLGARNNIGLLDMKMPNWVCTDVVDFKKPEFPDGMVFDKLTTVDAVEKYGCESNVLLMISPPPYPHTDKTGDLGYADYYACFDFIKQTLENPSTKFIIFVGELGAADGSSGMYKYLTTHPHLDSVCREMVDKYKDMFGGFCEKELFIFAIRI